MLASKFKKMINQIVPPHLREIMSKMEDVNLEGKTETERSLAYMTVMQDLDETTRDELVKVLSRLQLRIAAEQQTGGNRQQRRRNKRLRVMGQRLDRGSFVVKGSNK